ncbi:efflux transporter outer membrane subunit [Novosphingobium sp.]|uniref:efflux transporter outer membrane subunit n=1 Tax=Novosphingobium sp. TaxID=1874826 RepID=UPI003B52DB03
MTRAYRFLAVAPCFLAGALVTACSVGPNFHAPAAPVQTAYDKEGTAPMIAPAGVAGGAQQWVAGMPQDKWWLAYGSAQLDTLVDEALRANTDLAAANAALKAANETYLSTRGILLPTVDGAINATQNKSSQYLSPVPNANSFHYGLQTAQVTVGYQLDLFGLNRRTVEQSRAQYDMQAYQTQAARISLINNVIAAALLEASLRAQLASQERLIAIQQKTLDILHRQLAAGQIAGADVLAQDAALAAAQAALPPLRRAHAQATDLIAYLTGRSAATALPDVINLASIALPRDLPLSLPSELVRQRPDIRAAEAQLHAASAAVGIATANRLPQITLTAAGGASAGGFGSILSAANSFWTLGAGLAQPIFQGGTLLHKQRAARAAYDQADAQYRSAVLAAFQNVADTLAALRTDTEALDADVKARDSAQASMKVSAHLFEQGQTSFANALIAETALRQAEQTLVQAQVARLTDTAALFEALGGGWSGGKP